MFNCPCGSCFKSEIGFKIHQSRKCDCGKYMDVITIERMIAKPFKIFMSELKYLNDNTLLSDEDRIIRILHYLKSKYLDRNLPYKIMNNTHTYLKGFNNIIEVADKKNDDEYIDYKFSKITTCDFLNIFIKSLNNIVEQPIKTEINEIKLKYIVSKYLYK